MLDLAYCDDFDLGRVRARPSSCELLTANDVVTIEHKPMQVLVALALADGRVVARDALVEQCWGARVVGDDAINRVIGKLRRVADGLEVKDFRIETIPRIGYRLVATAVEPLAVVPAPPVPSLVPPPPTHSHWSRALLLIPAALGAMLLAVWQPWRDIRPAAPHAAAAMPAAVTNLETRGLAEMFENSPEQTAEAIGYLRQAAVLAPHAAPVWGSLAMGYVLRLGWILPAERGAVATWVRDAARHALALDPREARSTAALVSLEPTFGHWAAKDAMLTAAEARAHPDLGPLAYQRVQFLMAVGRTGAALEKIERVAKASPLVPWISASRIDLLAAAGRLEEADRAAAEAATIWPRDRLIWLTRFDLAVFNGQPDKASAMTADHAGWPKETTPKEVELAARVAGAIGSRDPAEVAAAVRALEQAIPAGHANAERAIRAAAAIGQLDFALATARHLYLGRLPAQPRATVLPLIGLPSDGDPPTAALFLPPARALWRTPGMWKLSRQIGLIDYWHRTGAPDLCSSAENRGPCLAAGLLR